MNLDSMRILYLGSDSPESTSRHRADALKRIGINVKHLDPITPIKQQIENQITSKVYMRIGYVNLINKVYKWIIEELNANKYKYDLIWVNGGEYLSPKSISLLKKTAPIILYNNDHPTGKRDGLKFLQVRNCLRKGVYDLCITHRIPSKHEMEEMGDNRVEKVWMSYDEIHHAPFENSAEIPEKFRSEVAFIGTWMRHENRDKFMIQLIEAGIPVAIWGDRWQKSPLWHRLRKCYRGESLIGRDYVAAIQGAKICLGLLCKGNHDLHTRRSLEIPYAGGLFCAERTSEHLELYREGVEAVFWSSSEECIARCKELLANETLRERIRLAGMKRVRDLKVGNQDICINIVQKLQIYEY